MKTLRDFYFHLLGFRDFDEKVEAIRHFADNRRSSLLSKRKFSSTKKFKSEKKSTISRVKKLRSHVHDADVDAEERDGWRDR